MARQDLVDHIKAEMGGWDGLPARAEDTYTQLPKLDRNHPVDPDVLAKLLADFNENWRQFGLRVRRDILVLEKLVIPDNVQRRATLYGDPGDPPLDPDI